MSKKEINIKDTKLVVEESKKIAQLFSSKYYSEIAIDSSKFITTEKIDLKKSILSLTNTSYKDSLETKIVLIATGNCYASNNLNKIKIIKTPEKESCHLIVPKAEITNTVVNPSDFIIFFDGGNWSEKEVQQIKHKAVTKIKTLALKNGIIEKANERTSKLLTDFLKTAEYKNIKIEFK
ncbi:DUF4230 domain-containing protein [Tenacibaculum finnmarkense]|uniref:DUF4230 domain-containing protein n=1 Tax=Tenacibaculum finnmarkense TaxID=2781243 RepID=UPI001EFB6E6B|nr:DUF4230 domain-containing protein [Tenacibaculum finnmarkense]MCG8889020.1 DUF4230 domain-containing protein [Tenacibaculum finnmarkense]